MGNKRVETVIIAALFAIPCFLLTLNPVQAQSSYPQYPPIRHDVPYYAQDTMVWCWVAVAKMVSEYYNKDVPDQCVMLMETYHVDCCSNPQQCMRGGYVPEVQALITRYGLRYSQVVPPANGFLLYDALRRGPLILHTRQGAGHFVVATGMRVEKTAYGPLGIVYISDPFYGEYEVTFPELIPAWISAIVVF